MKFLLHDFCIMQSDESRKHYSCMYCCCACVTENKENVAIIRATRSSTKSGIYLNFCLDLCEHNDTSGMYPTASAVCNYSRHISLNSRPQPIWIWSERLECYCCWRTISDNVVEVLSWVVNRLRFSVLRVTRFIPNGLNVQAEWEEKEITSRKRIFALSTSSNILLGISYIYCLFIL